jgi:DMSO/TMAO reductase YedYZ molybdopterin-dependent catalytic subunit
MSDSRSSRSGDPVPRSSLLTRRALLAGALQSLAMLAACAAPLPAPVVPAAQTPGSRAATGGEMATPLPTPAAIAPPPTATVSAAAAQSTAAACQATKVVVPTPIPYPGYAQEEPSTGLHVTGPAARIDLAAYRFEVSGLVDRPLSLTYDALRCLPKVKAHVSWTCPGFFTDDAVLAGPTVASLLALAGAQPEAKSITFTSTDGYAIDFTLEQIQGEENFLAHEWRDEPLPPSHGFPLRVVAPGATGGRWVKWLGQMTLH